MAGEIISAVQLTERLGRLEDRVRELQTLQTQVRILENQAHTTFGMLTSICAQLEARLKKIEPPPSTKRHWWNR